MAHSVRNRLTKLGTRFSRSDSHSRSPIRSSTSLIRFKFLFYFFIQYVFLSMNKPSQIPKTKMAKSSSMEATRNISSASKAPNNTFINTTNTTNSLENENAPMLRSQITLIPSPCRSPRSFITPELSKQVKTSEEKINLPSTIQEEPTVSSDTEASEAIKAQIVSPISVATTSSSNTDTIYSGKVSSSTKPITSPDWSEASNVKPTAPSSTTAVISNAILTSPEKDKSIAENIPPLKIIEEEINLKKNFKDSGTTKSPLTSQKLEKVSKTPKLAAKFGFGGNKSSSKTQKVLPSPKIKIKKGNLKETISGKIFLSAKIVITIVPFSIQSCRIIFAYSFVTRMLTNEASDLYI